MISHHYTCNTVGSGNPALTDVLLLIQSNAHDGAIIFSDAGNDGRTISVAGAVEHTTDYGSPFDGYTSAIYVPATEGVTAGLYVDLPEVAELTIDCWFYKSAGVGCRIMGGMYAPLSTFYLGVMDDGYLYAAVGDTNTLVFQPTVAIATGWHHVALTWDGINVSLFIDGVLGVLTTTTSTQTIDASIIVGQAVNSGAGACIITEFRLMNKCVWTGVGHVNGDTVFTPPSAPYVAPPAVSWPADVLENGILVVQSDTTDGSTVFVDEGIYAATLTVSGNVQHDTDQYKNGASAILFSSSADALSRADLPAIGTDDFTIDLWVRPTGTGMKCFTLGAQLSITLYPTAIAFAFAPNSTLYAVTTITANTWVHIAISRLNGTVYIFADGSLCDSGVRSTAIATDTFTIGGNPFVGHIAQLAIRKECVWSGVGYSVGDQVFTPPATLY